MKIAIVGTGYVGLVTGVSLAALGHDVWCVGRNRDKIAAINAGQSPFYEPGLEALLNRVLLKKLLHAADDIGESINNADVIIIAVGTPTVRGKIDLSSVKQVSKQIGEALKKSKKYHLVVVKSTVVPTTTEKIIKPLLEKYAQKKVGEFGLCMNPEFLREGSALEDALYPDRIIIGQYDKKSGRKFSKLYAKLSCPKIFTNLATAEMIKYAANSLFATLISFSNEIARISEATERVDVVDVWKGVHLDKRLNPIVGRRRISPGILRYIFSGCGYGGSCFPKDTKALVHYARGLHINPQILKSVIDVNQAQPERILLLLKETIGKLEGKKIAVLGLSFKPNTDDLRESPALYLIDLLLGQKATVSCHDPVAYKNGRNAELKSLPIVLSNTAEESLKDADAAVLMTAWDEYKKLTPAIFKRALKRSVVVDGRRVFSKEQFIKAGIVYKGIGYRGATQ